VLIFTSVITTKRTEIMKLTKKGCGKYEATVNDIVYKVTVDTYSYYKQYNLIAVTPDGSCTDYSYEFMPNLKTVREFIKSLNK
jgi:hypothetical protein